MNRWRRQREAERAYKKARALLSSPERLTASPERGEVLATLLLTERERLLRHRSLSMITMLDGTPSLSWTADGINFTPDQGTQLEIQQLIETIIDSEPVPAPAKFPSGSPYAGWLVKDPFFLQEPRTVEDEPLFNDEMIAPALELVAVSKGFVVHKKLDEQTCYIDPDGVLERLLVRAASEADPRTKPLLKTWGQLPVRKALFTRRR